MRPAGIFASGRRDSSILSVSPSSLAVAIASFVVRPLTSGTWTSRVRSAMRIAVAAAMRKVAPSAATSRKNLPSVQTRVLRAIKRSSIVPHERGSEERLELVDVRLRAEMAARIEQLAGERRRGGAQIERRKARRRREERDGKRFVFLRLARTRRIQQVSAGCHRVRRALQHRQLRGRQRREVAFVSPPADGGIARER